MCYGETKGIKFCKYMWTFLDIQVTTYKSIDFFQISTKLDLDLTRYKLVSVKQSYKQQSVPSSLWHTNEVSALIIQSLYDIFKPISGQKYDKIRTWIQKQFCNFFPHYFLQQNLHFLVVCKVIQFCLLHLFKVNILGGKLKNSFIPMTCGICPLLIKWVNHFLKAYFRSD